MAKTSEIHKCGPRTTATTLHFCQCVLPLASMLSRHGLISANDLPGATTLRGGRSLPHEETLTIIIEKMTRVRLRRRHPRECTQPS